MTSAPGGTGRFDDWDEPAVSVTAGEDDAQLRSDLFMDSPLYSIDNFLRLKYIKESLIITCIFGFLTLIPFILKSLGSLLLIYVLVVSSENITFEIFISILTINIVFILCLISVVLNIMKKPSAVSMYSYSIISLFIGILILLLYIRTSIPLFGFFIVFTFCPSACAYLLWRRSKTLSSFQSLKESRHPIAPKEFKDALKRTYSNLFTMFNHNHMEIVPGSLSDKLETSLIKQLVDQRVISAGIESQFKTTSVRTALRTIASRQRLILYFTLLSFLNVFLLFSIHGSFDYSNSSMSVVVSYLISFGFLAGLYLLFFSDRIRDYYSSGSLDNYHDIFSLMIVSSVAVCFYLCVFISAYYDINLYSPQYLNHVRFVSGLGLFFSAIGIFLSSKYLIRRIEASIALRKIIAEPGRKSLNSLCAVDLILCGFQKNVDNIDEDGWE